MAAQKQNVTWRDSKGHTARNSFFIDAATPALQAAAAAAVIVAEEAITNAAVQSTSGPSTSSPLPVAYGTTADFPAVEDKAVFTFATGNGSLHRLQVPAPKIAIFEVDTVTVDASQADAAAFITAVIANVFDRSGGAITSFVGGVRTRRKLQRKLTIFTLVPELDEPAE